MARALEGSACLVLAQGHAERALKLAAAAAHLRRLISAPLHQAEQFKFELALRPAWESLSEAEGKHAWKEGSAMSLEKPSNTLWRSRGPLFDLPKEALAEIQKIVSDAFVPADFDVAQITWHPDYDLAYYRQLARWSKRLYLFRTEYIFELDHAVEIETPQLGHATYLFRRPSSMNDFLSFYAKLAKDDIRRSTNKNSSVALPLSKTEL